MNSIKAVVSEPLSGNEGYHMLVSNADIGFLNTVTSVLFCFHENINTGIVQVIIYFLNTNNLFCYIGLLYNLSAHAFDRLTISPSHAVFPVYNF